MLENGNKRLTVEGLCVRVMRKAYLYIIAVFITACNSGQGPVHQDKEQIAQEQTGNEKEVNKPEVKVPLEEEVLFSSKALPDLTLTPRELTLNNGEIITLQVAKGYGITIAAEDIKKPRFPAWSSDHRLFVPDMQYPYDNNRGKIYVLSDFDSLTGVFKDKRIYMDKLRNPHSIAFYQDIANQYWLYIALTDVLLRFPYQQGGNEPPGKADTVVTFPGYGQSFQQGGWHLTRTITFYNHKLYVSVGSSCNVCEEKEKERATILEMLPDGSDAHIYAAGLRNAVGLVWAKDKLCATNMGADHLGNDSPDDQFCIVSANDYYGWPWYYYNDNRPFADDIFDYVPQEISSKTLAKSVFTLGAHTAPLGLAYFNGDNNHILDDCFLIALHGSGRVSLKRGHSVLMFRPGASPKPFIDGFLKGKERQGRPCGVLPGGNGDFILTDDYAGVIYRVFPLN